jgi:hypothetical protein
VTVLLLVKSGKRKSANNYKCTCCFYGAVCNDFEGDEKLTTHFMSLSKIRGQEGAISDICDQNGQVFASAQSRSEYIKITFRIFWAQKS